MKGSTVKSSRKVEVSRINFHWTVPTTLPIRPKFICLTYHASSSFLLSKGLPTVVEVYGNELRTLTRPTYKNKDKVSTPLTTIL